MVWASNVASWQGTVIFKAFKRSTSLTPEKTHDGGNGNEGVCMSAGSEPKQEQSSRGTSLEKRASVKYGEHLVVAATFVGT